MSSWNPTWAQTPEFRREFTRLQRRDELAARMTHWMLRIPVVGRLVEAFWYLLIAEGFYQTLKPRWGALTFAFLNDGMGATVWHTWYSMTHDNQAPYSGIYAMGAPHSLKEAEAMEKRWKDEGMG